VTAQAIIGRAVGAQQERIIVQLQVTKLKEQNQGGRFSLRDIFKKQVPKINCLNAPKPDF
jgi:hypothetical protein